MARGLDALRCRFALLAAAIGLLACTESHGTERELPRIESADAASTRDAPLDAGMFGNAKSSSATARTASGPPDNALLTDDPRCPVDPKQANGTPCVDVDLRCIYAPACSGAQCHCRLDHPDDDDDDDGTDAGTQNDSAPPTAHFLCVHRAC